MHIHDGRTYVTCNRCRRSGACVKSTDPEAVSRGLCQLRWRPDPELSGKWICPKCLGECSGGGKDLSAKAPLPRREEQMPKRCQEAIDAAFEGHPAHVLN